MQVQVSEVARLEAERDRLAASGLEAELEQVERALEAARRKAEREAAAKRGQAALEQERLRTEEAERQAQARRQAQELAAERAPIAETADRAFAAYVASARALQANAIALGEVLGEIGERRDIAAALEEALWRSFNVRLRGVFHRHPAEEVPERKAGSTAELDARELRSFGLEVK